MKNLKTILVVAGVVYTLITIILMLNEEALYNSIGLLKLMDAFKYWMILGLIIIVGLIVAGSLMIRKLQKQNRLVTQEHAALKANLYDQEQSRKAEDAEAARRIEAFRHSIDRGGRPAGPTQPQS